MSGRRRHFGFGENPLYRDNIPRLRKQSLLQNTTSRVMTFSQPWKELFRKGVLMILISIVMFSPAPWQLTQKKIIAERLFSNYDIFLVDKKDSMRTNDGPRKGQRSLR